MMRVQVNNKVSSTSNDAPGTIIDPAIPLEDMADTLLKSAWHMTHYQ